MASYSVGINRSAERELRKIHKVHIPGILKKIKALAANPRPSGLILLRQENRHYRIRHGDYRIIFEVNDASKTVTVVKIGHRREVYLDR